jgi:hypothetical protein
MTVQNIGSNNKKSDNLSFLFLPKDRLFFLKEEYEVISGVTRCMDKA